MLRNTLIALIIVLFAVPALAQDATESVTESVTEEFVQYSTPVPALTEGQEQFIGGLDCEPGEECLVVSIDDLLAAGADSVPNPEPILDPESIESMLWSMVLIAITVVIGWVFVRWGDVAIAAVDAIRDSAPQWVVDTATQSGAEALQTLDEQGKAFVAKTPTELDDLAYENFRKIILDVLRETNLYRGNVAEDIEAQIFRAGSENLRDV